MFFLDSPICIFCNLYLTVFCSFICARAGDRLDYRSTVGSITMHWRMRRREWQRERERDVARWCRWISVWRDFPDQNWSLTPVFFFKLTTLSVWRLYSVGDRLINEYGAVGGMGTEGGNRNTRRKPVPVPLCAQFPYALTWDRTQAVRTISRPVQCNSCITWSASNLCIFLKRGSSWGDCLDIRRK
jgi:hypothetical protein